MARAPCARHFTGINPTSTEEKGVYCSLAIIPQRMPTTVVSAALRFLGRLLRRGVLHR